MSDPITFGSLFAGIGGMDLGLERAGMTCAWQVEIDPHARRVLARHWPDVRRWDDVRTFPPEPVDEWRCDLIAGGFPCQGASDMGRRLGLADPRTGLWSEFARVLRTLRPRVALVENVPGLLRRGFGRVLGDLAEIGFDAEWFCLPASALGAPHQRERLFVLAYSPDLAIHRPPATERSSARVQDAQWSDPPVFPRLEKEDWYDWLVRIGQESQRAVSSSAFHRVDDGIPAGLDRYVGLGNAVVPQVAEWIGRRILSASVLARTGPGPGGMA